MSREVYENPLIVRNAWQRVYDMVVSHGYDEYSEHKENKIRYRMIDRVSRSDDSGQFDQLTFAIVYCGQQDPRIGGLPFGIKCRALG